MRDATAGASQIREVLGFSIEQSTSMRWSDIENLSIRFPKSTADWEEALKSGRPRTCVSERRRGGPG
eukprot:5363981-Pyramimonas_sp.AAC.1